ncbi:MAG: SpoIIE family protein phosphatase [Lachnospiraceae bacterium]
MLRRTGIREYKKIKMEAVLLPAYGKQKLLTYADTFRDLAKTFTYLPSETEESEQSYLKHKNSQDRQNAICKSRLLENRGILADHLNEMAQIMTHVAEESYELLRINDKRKKQLMQSLRSHGILIQNIYMIENDNQHIEVSMQMKMIKDRHFTVEDTAGLLSVLLHKRLHPVKNSLMFIQKEYETFIFVEEPTYEVLTGVAKAVKENEKMSGDNYSFMEVSNGNFLCAISDGMGSGEKACRDSGMVIDLLEKLLEAGFARETAIQMINGMLIAREEEQNMSTLDACAIDLYSGIATFSKVGATASYLKRNNSIEIIEENNLPLGIFQQMEVESVTRSLISGDYIIMVSDGVMDVFGQENAVYRLQEFIGRIEMENPREIANHILQFVICTSSGQIRDDMTVMVIGIWEAEQES